jgi:hypothetical protein
MFEAGVSKEHCIYLDSGSMIEDSICQRYVQLKYKIIHIDGLLPF